MDAKEIKQLRLYAVGHHDDDILNNMLDTIENLQKVVDGACGQCTIMDFAKREWCSQCGFAHLHKEYLKNKYNEEN